MADGGRGAWGFRRRLRWTSRRRSRKRWPRLNRAVASTRLASLNLRHPRESGDPAKMKELGSRFRGNDDRGDEMSASFPYLRMRRGRSSPWMRAMLAEHRLHPSDFIWPLFICEGQGCEEAIA